MQILKVVYVLSFDPKEQKLYLFYSACIRFHNVAIFSFNWYKVQK